MIVIVVFVLLIALAVRCRALTDKNNAYAKQIETLEEKINEEKDRGDNFDNLKNYTKTDAYIEKVAREKLGLVYPDEIIFRASDKN